MSSSTYKGSTPVPRTGRAAYRTDKWLVVAIAVAMVLMAYLWRAFLATTLIAPLASTAPSGGHTFPKLIDATAIELAAGLDKGEFSSVDLVKVSWGIPMRP
jgi:hypothetical protein